MYASNANGRASSRPMCRRQIYLRQFDQLNTIARHTPPPPRETERAAAGDLRAPAPALNPAPAKGSVECHRREGATCLAVPAEPLRLRWRHLHRTPAAGHAACRRDRTRSQVIRRHIASQTFNGQNVRQWGTMRGKGISCVAEEDGSRRGREKVK